MKLSLLSHFVLPKSPFHLTASSAIVQKESFFVNTCTLVMTKIYDPVFLANTSLDELMMGLINGYEVFEQAKLVEVKSEVISLAISK